MTRDEAADGPLCGALRAAGLDPLLEPVLMRTVDEAAREALNGIAPGDFVVLTSPFAINAVHDLPAVRAARVAVVGAPSAALARDAGLNVVLVGADGRGETLFAQLRDEVSSGSVWYPRSSQAHEPKPWAGITLHSPVLYRTEPRSYRAEVRAQCDVASLTSPSAVRVVGPIDQPVASIGETTSAAIAQELGRTAEIVAATPTFAALAAAIAAWGARRS